MGVFGRRSDVAVPGCARPVGGGFGPQRHRLVNTSRQESHETSPGPRSPSARAVLADTHVQCEPHKLIEARLPRSCALDVGAREKHANVAAKARFLAPRGPVPSQPCSVSDVALDQPLGIGLSSSEGRFFYVAFNRHHLRVTTASFCNATRRPPGCDRLARLVVSAAAREGWQLRRDVRA